MTTTNITVENLSVDELTKETWNFALSLDSWGYRGLALDLSSYHKYIRPSKRHRKWEAVTGWGHGGEYGRYHKNTNPHLPLWVLRKAMAQAMEQLKVTLAISVPTSTLSRETAWVSVGAASTLAAMDDENLTDAIVIAKANLAQKVTDAHAARALADKRKP